MTISEKKMQIVIDNYFKSECDVNTSIRQAFEKGFRIGVKKGQSADPQYKELQDWKTDFKGFVDDLLYISRDDYRGIMEYIDEVPSAEPDVPDRNVGDMIYRQAAIDLITGQPPEPHYPSWYAEQIKGLPSAEPEINKQKLIRTMNAGIIATSTEDVYSCGMRNGIRWCRALLEDDLPKFEDASQYAELERPKGEWIPHKSIFGGPEEKVYTCNQCGYNIGFHTENFCPNCGLAMIQEVKE